MKRERCLAGALVAVQRALQHVARQLEVRQAADVYRTV
jgi:hypothetical protein